MTSSITAIILTYNEEKHITRCINSLKPYVNQIFVVDSFSTDNTISLAKALNVKVFQNAFVNQAVQFNWALKNCPITTNWIWRIDADEYIDTQLGENVEKAIQEVTNDITGIYVKRKIVYLGTPLMHGTWYPRWYLKVFRFGYGECENRWMDEHIKLVSGKTIKVEGNQTDDNLNDLTWWTQKHNSYASREMLDTLFTEFGLGISNDVKPNLFGNDEERLRWLKLRYVKFPLFIRPFINFGYRYFIRFGFLDGRAGFMWHILQGFWYRMLIDAKVFEIKRSFKNNPEELKSYLKKHYNI